MAEASLTPVARSVKASPRDHALPFSKNMKRTFQLSLLFIAAVKCYASGFVFCHLELTQIDENEDVIMSGVSLQVSELRPSSISVGQDIQSGVPDVELSLGNKLHAMLDEKDGDLQYTLIFSVTEVVGDGSIIRRDNSMQLIAETTEAVDRDSIISSDDLVQLTTKTYRMTGDLVLDESIDHKFDGSVIRLKFSDYRLVDGERIRAIAKERGLKQKGNGHSQ